MLSVLVENMASHSGYINDFSPSLRDKFVASDPSVIERLEPFPCPPVVNGDIRLKIVFHTTH